jgi:predicted Zn-dependent protease with MMP-like domain
MPDKIAILQGPHERLSRTQAELEKMVFDTVWHEIAHHFGRTNHVCAERNVAGRIDMDYQELSKN